VLLAMVTSTAVLTGPASAYARRAGELCEYALPREGLVVPGGSGG